MILTSQGGWSDERTNMNHRMTIKVKGAELMFIERRMPTWRSGYKQRDMNSLWTEYNEAPRMYVSVDDETILENLENRRRRPYNVYKTMIAISDIDTALNLETLRWSQHAGCRMCPCSPGFIIPKQEVTIGQIKFAKFDVWVKLDGAPAVDERKASRVVVGV